MPKLQLTSEECADFLLKLNEKEDEVELTDFESQFLDSNIKRIEQFGKKDIRFSEGQCACIDRMVKKFRDAIKW